MLSDYERLASVSMETHAAVYLRFCCSAPAMQVNPYAKMQEAMFHQHMGFQDPSTLYQGGHMGHDMGMMPPPNMANMVRGLSCLQRLLMEFVSAYVIYGAICIDTSIFLGWLPLLVLIERMPFSMDPGD